MGTPQDPPARAKQKARRRRKEARLREKKAAAQAAQTEKKLTPTHPPCCRPRERCPSRIPWDDGLQQQRTGGSSQGKYTSPAMSTVLFVHGLESGPRGRKARAIQAAGHLVLSGQMPCGRKAILRNPDVLAFLSLCGAGTLGATLALGLKGFLASVGASSTLALLGAPLLVRQVLRQSVEVQANMLASHPVDLILGSSFGGAVCIELLAQGIWKGPTVLLCPAHQRVATLARKTPPTLPPGARVLVIHGRQDRTVPIEHSRALAHAGATLLEVDDDHRLSSSATPENLRRWIEQAQTLQGR